MMDKRAVTVARRLIRKYRTRDPEEIAANLGVQVKRLYNLKHQKGFFKVIANVCFIFVNGNLSEQMQRTDVVDDTEIIEVDVTMDSAEDALALAEAIAEIMPVYVTEIVEGSSVQIIDMPILPDTIYSPNYIKNAVIGGVLCAFLAAAVILLRELLDDTVKEEETLENRFGISVIGVIPDLAAADKHVSHYGGYAQSAETQSAVNGKLVKSK